MRSLIKPLGAVFVLQLALWAFLQFSGSKSAVAQASLFEAQIENSSGLTLEIADAEGLSAVLSRNDSGWQLASGLPADTKKVDDLLAKLQMLRLRWPVSTNAGAHDRFEVANDNFQRRLKISGNDADTTLFFGTSPGYQQSHARGEDDAVYAVKVANYELPAAVDEWLDKSLLAAVGDVTLVAWNEGEDELRVSRAADGWKIGEPAANAAANIQPTTAAVERVATLAVLGVLESAPSAAPADAKVILLRDSEGEYRLSFWARESNNDHVVMSTRYPGEAFRVSNYVAEQLVPAPESLKAPALPQVDLQALDLEPQSQPETQP